MQAARGTPVGTSLPDDADAAAGPSGAGGSRQSSRRRRWARPLLLVTALAAYAVDVATKALAVERLQGRPDVEVVGTLLQLRYATNPGAAFSTGTAFTEALSVFALVAAVAVALVGLRVRTPSWAVALGLLLAGITGNLTDRLVREPGPFRGEVVDFLMLPNWPIFNVADVCINVGALLVLVLAWRGVRLDGTRTRDDETDEADTTDEAGEPDEPDEPDENESVTEASDEAPDGPPTAAPADPSDPRS